MARYNINIPQTLRFNLLILVLSVLSGANLFSAHAKFESSYLKNNAIERGNIGKIQDNESFLFNYTLVKAKKDNHSINLSFFEMEEDDDFSYSKKGFKLYQQITSISFNRFVEYKNTSRRISSFSRSHSLTKYPLYITYQMHRI